MDNNRLIMAKINITIKYDGGNQPSYIVNFVGNDNKIVENEIKFNKRGKPEKLFKFLAANCGRFYSRDYLMSEVWGDHDFVQNRSIDAQITFIRNILKPFIQLYSQEFDYPNIVDFKSSEYKLLSEFQQKEIDKYREHLNPIICNPSGYSLNKDLFQIFIKGNEDILPNTRIKNVIIEDADVIVNAEYKCGKISVIVLGIATSEEFAPKMVVYIENREWKTLSIKEFKYKFKLSC